LGQAADETQIAEGLVVVRILILIAGQMTSLNYLVESTLNDPASRQHDEACLISEILEDSF